MPPPDDDAMTASGLDVVGSMAGWTTGAMLAERARRDPDRPFVQPWGEPAHSFGEVHQQARQAAFALAAAGVGRGDPVVLMLHNGLEAIVAWFGANLLGAVDVAINTAYRGASLEHALNQVGARCIVIGAEFVPLLQAIAERLPQLRTVFVVGSTTEQAGAPWPLQDFAEACAGAPACELPVVMPRETASVIYTSGTTGPAKGALLPHAQVVLLAQRTVHHCRLGPGDVYYSFHPLHHMAGKFMQVLACVVAGAHLVLDRKFDPAAWLQRIRLSGATHSGGHGPMLEMIHAQPASPQDREHRLRVLCSAPFPRHIASDFEARFGLRGLECWGMTEVGVPLWNSLDEPLRAGCCGRVDAEWFEFRVLHPETDAPLPCGEVGEFVVRPRHPWTLSQGYAGLPDKTVEAWRNLWFHTGDLGHVDAEGYVYFGDRVAERIRRRAENVSAYEIEVAAQSHAAVAEAAAVGTPSEFAGDDDIRLFVVARAGTSLQPEALLRHLAAHLPHHMVPRYIDTVAELPRSATHKIQRALLRREPMGLHTWDRKAQGIELRELIGRA